MIWRVIRQGRRANFEGFTSVYACVYKNYPFFSKYYFILIFKGSNHFWVGIRGFMSKTM